MQTEFMNCGTIPLLREPRQPSAPLMHFLGTPGDHNLPEDEERDGKATSDLAPAGATASETLPRILIVGGGAGGLELAARLGNTAGRRREAEIVLVDVVATHLWKPLLHEVAAGTLAPRDNELDFLQQARQHHFRFHLGRLQDVDRRAKQIWLAPLVDDDGLEIAPRRPLSYDTLVIAIGGTDNDFGTPGVREHAISLNSPAEAEHFHRRLLSLCTRAELTTGAPVNIVIVGGGATGVELAAELTEAVEEIASYGSQLQQMKRPVRICVVEAGKRLLGGLPQELAERVHDDLVGRGVDLRVNHSVAKVERGRVILRNGDVIGADVTVWAAGVQGPEVLNGLGGLETNRQRQLVVRPTLQTTRDADIFAIGDCASFTPEGGKPVPPKAQVAQQEAKLLARSLRRRLAGKPPIEFSYKERGALIPLGQDEAVGSLNTPGSGKRLRVGGNLARFSYWALYHRHLAVLLGGLRTVLITVGQWLTHRSQPRVKLH
ncbi:MAG: NAD(P)/FAD-dependent oxidoreductase [Aromatoleum sp.]|jgi:NADH dehydrogenase|uniref:NAD(P)/FAD-dependent oxidoreductase n=1 Tax=Aromatoleum sp. TaxID=2307007 RepID=UPI00289423A3|nr:NAD(P)/FAD-dependent oxidoreductase [Aromatoleum sp.]MDT3671123.1 NAD(P)/FAD-dependent oxidoreductase [Aromatoleum sp.]